MKTLPKAGEFVDLRGRLWLVEEQLRDSSSAPSLRLSCVDDDAQGETAAVLWDAEIAACSRDDELWGLIGDHGTDDATLSVSLATIAGTPMTGPDPTNSARCAPPNPSSPPNVLSMFSPTVRKRHFRVVTPQ